MVRKAGLVPDSLQSVRSINFRRVHTYQKVFILTGQLMRMPKKIHGVHSVYAVTRSQKLDVSSGSL